MRLRGWRQALGGALAALALAGCGESRTFTAEEFVEEVNAEGVKLELGRELISDQSEEELYAIELEPVVELPGGERHAGGSISVSEESGGADDELASCRASADLLCFRAANVVVVLEGGGIEAERLGVAIERIAED